MEYLLFLAIFVFIATLLIVILTYKKPYNYKDISALVATKSQGSWHDYFYTSIKKVIKGGIYDEAIRKSGINTTTKKILVEQIVLPIILILGSGALSLITKMPFFIGCGVFISAILVYVPIAKLKTAERKRRMAIRNETPNFVLTVRLLLKGKKTPVEALKLACDYGSGKAMRSYTDELHVNLDVMQPDVALTRFANDTEVVELMEFASLFGQYIKIGATKDGEEILRQLELTFRELDSKLLEREKEIRPLKLKMINYALGINGIAFMITTVILYLVGLLGTSKL